MIAFKPMTSEMEEDSFEAYLYGQGEEYTHKKSLSPTICLHCSHFNGFSDDGVPVCKAFPDGIPDKFWDAKADHTTPYTGDNGITFEP